VCGLGRRGLRIRGRSSLQGIAAAGAVLLTTDYAQLSSTVGELRRGHYGSEIAAEQGPGPPAFGQARGLREVWIVEVVLD
jgi:hypothetical protein